ncbi:hypothetical protein ACP70R_033535 [Stipagrostis hirtigluma subsp. patula]
MATQRQLMCSIFLVLLVFASRRLLFRKNAGPDQKRSQNAGPPGTRNARTSANKRTTSMASV